MSKKEFLIKIIESFKTEKNDNNWRGTLSNWIKC